VVQKFQENCSLLDKLKGVGHKQTLTTDETTQHVEEAVQRSPRKSVSCLLQLVFELHIKFLDPHAIDCGFTIVI
jgi:hypothetical protein